MNYNKALEIIREFEGFRAKPYKLKGESFYTVGYGRSRCDPYRITTKNEEELWLRARVNRDAQIIIDSSPELNNNQLNALISFVFNVGVGAYKNSTLLKRLHNFDAKASEELLRWNKDSTLNVSPGLVRRRKAEKELFDTPVKTATNKDIAKLSVAAKWTTGEILHQNEAWNWLESTLTESQKQTFTKYFRNKS